MRRRKPGECVCHCHLTGMTGAFGPCGWCIDLHRPRPKETDQSDGDAGPDMPPSTVADWGEDDDEDDEDMDDG